MKKPAKNSTKKTAAPAAPSPITPDQIDGRIASLECEKAALQQEQTVDDKSHQAACETYQARLGARLKKNSELTGAITTLRALLA
jgi:hypothetical protein